MYVQRKDDPEVQHDIARMENSIQVYLVGLLINIALLLATFFSSWLKTRGSPADKLQEFDYW